FNMWRPPSDPEFPWPSLFITSTIVGIWYWCTDQYIVQRTLTAKNLKEARRGTIWGAALKLLPVFLFLVPGVIALVLKQRGEIHWDSPDQAFPVLMSNLLPSGMRGLVAAGLLAALMSSLASVFNSCSTLFTVDIYKKLKPNTPEKKLVNIGRISTAIVVILGILWIPIMANISGVLYEYLQKVQTYISAPIATIFLLGIFYKRINSYGAMATLISGFFIAGGRIILELMRDSLTEGSIIHTLATMNFLTFGAYFFLLCIVIAIGVSLATPAMPREKLVGLTFGTLSDEQKASRKNSYNWVDIITSLVVLAIVIYVMTTFNGK
ncbi:MAG: sodium/solute symporter, partial [Cyclobacteriaceae bacterium]|nr:sodium/solute symporter [Cyclobacteriaceae bacterium]